jgi:hypothetical protein
MPETKEPVPEVKEPTKMSMHEIFYDEAQLGVSIELEHSPLDEGLQDKQVDESEAQYMVPQVSVYEVDKVTMSLAGDLYKIRAQDEYEDMR